MYTLTYQQHGPTSNSHGRRSSAILRLLQSEKMEDVGGFDNDYNTTFPGNESFQPYDDNHVTRQQNAADQFSSIVLRRVVWYVIAVAQGIPDNVLSAIVWLRRHISRNSSAVYLVALAINDLVYLLCYCLYKLIEDLHPSPYDVLRNSSYGTTIALTTQFKSPSSVNLCLYSASHCSPAAGLSHVFE